MRSFELARKIVKKETVNEKGEKIVVKEIATDELGNELLAYPDAQLPMYMTKYAAGADFFAVEDTVIPSIWKLVIGSISSKANQKINKLTDFIVSELGYEVQPKDTELVDIIPTFVNTGIKANMEDDEVLEIYNRSSNPKKLGLVLANSVGK